jgi:hypothetical protein
VAASLPQGWQSLGNGAAGSAAHLYPNLIANHDYNFPLSDALWGTVPTNAIGLIEPGVGTALPSTATQSFAALVDAYRAGAGITTPVSVTSVANGGQEFPPGSGFMSASERSLDVGVVTTLTRALTDIAHSQMWFGSVPELINSDNHGGWTSGADQTLLFQIMSAAATDVGVHSGPNAFGFFSTASGSFAWTSQLAQQSLTGEALAVSISTSPVQAIQGTLSSPFGFADFLSGGGDVRVARPVAVAETAGAQNDQLAIVRLRQDGQYDLSLTFYRVDDLSDAINGLHPGDPGYQAALQSRAYQMTSGGTSINGPGYGNYEQTGLQHVNAGDLVAMQLTNNTHNNSYLGFAQANETVNGAHVGHLWNYGLNTWGWEDTYGGGDHDYNDLIVGIDFTSTSGHGWLT